MDRIPHLSEGGLSMGLALTRFLQDDFGAVVHGYDVDPGGVVTVEMTMAPASRQFRFGQRAACIATSGRMVERNRIFLLHSRAHAEVVKAFLQGSRVAAR